MAFMCSAKVRSERKITLASASPRRKELLSLLPLQYEVHPPHVDETDQAGETPEAMAARLAQDKAHAALSYTHTGIIVAADTLVFLDGKVLGKPQSPQEATEMLTRLRGRAHQVYTGVTVIDVDARIERTGVAMTVVHMRNYSDEEIARYVASGDPMDKAGAYAIQYHDFSPVERFEGCYSNVMGLPLCHLVRLLRETGIDLEDSPAWACNRFHDRTCEVAEDILHAI